MPGIDFSLLGQGSGLEQSRVLGSLPQQPSGLNSLASGIMSGAGEASNIAVNNQKIAESQQKMSEDKTTFNQGQEDRQAQAMDEQTIRDASAKGLDNAIQAYMKIGQPDKALGLQQSVAKLQSTYADIRNKTLTGDKQQATNSTQVFAQGAAEADTIRGSTKDPQAQDRAWNIWLSGQPETISKLLPQTISDDNNYMAMHSVGMGAMADLVQKANAKQKAAQKSDDYKPVTQTDQKLLENATNTNNTIVHLVQDATDAKQQLKTIPDSDLGPVVNYLKTNALNPDVQKLNKLLAEMPFLNKSLVGISQGMRFTQGELDQLNKITGTAGNYKSAIQWIMDRTQALGAERIHQNWQEMNRIRSDDPNSSRYQNWLKLNPEPPKEIQDPDNTYLHPEILTKGSSSGSSGPIQLPSFNSKEEFQSWYGQQNPQTQAAVRAQLK